MKVIKWVSISVLSLVLAGLAFLFFAPGYNLYLVRSESMRPTIDMGDLIITRPPNNPIKEEVKPGTIITYRYSNELITHRVLSIDSNNLVTKGDATEDPDPWTINFSNIEGIYMFRIPNAGYVTSFVQTKLGWFLAIIIPAALFVGWLAKDIVKEALSDA